MTRRQRRCKRLSAPYCVPTTTPIPPYLIRWPPDPVGPQQAAAQSWSAPLGRADLPLRIHAKSPDLNIEASFPPPTGFSRSRAASTVCKAPRRRSLSCFPLCHHLKSSRLAVAARLKTLPFRLARVGRPSTYIQMISPLCSATSHPNAPRLRGRRRAELPAGSHRLRLASTTKMMAAFDDHSCSTSAIWVQTNVARAAPHTGAPPLDPSLIEPDEAAPKGPAKRTAHRLAGRMTPYPGRALSTLQMDATVKCFLRIIFRPSGVKEACWSGG